MEHYRIPLEYELYTEAELTEAFDAFLADNPSPNVTSPLKNGELNDASRLLREPIQLTGSNTPDESNNPIVAEVIPITGDTSGENQPITVPPSVIDMVEKEFHVLTDGERRIGVPKTMVCHKCIRNPETVSDDIIQEHITICSCCKKGFCVVCYGDASLCKKCVEDILKENEGHKESFELTVVCTSGNKVDEPGKKVNNRIEVVKTMSGKLTFEGNVYSVIDVVPVNKTYTFSRQGVESVDLDLKKSQAAYRFTNPTGKRRRGVNYEKLVAGLLGGKNVWCTFSLDVKNMRLNFVKSTPGE